MDGCERSRARVRRTVYDFRLLAPLFLLGVLVARGAAAAPLFGAPRTYQVDGSPVKVVANQLDAQPGLDLVTGNQVGADGPSLSLLFNRGQGTFFPEVRKNLNAARYTLQSIATADFNNDGFGDLAVAAIDLTVFPVQTLILVYRNDGTGQLLGPEQYPLGGLVPQCVEAADVNGDGVVDLVVCQTVISGQGLVSVLPGQSVDGTATGTFGVAADFAVGTSPMNLTVGDVDGDGHADVLVGDRNERKVFILYGTGDFRLFGGAVPLGDVTSPTAVAVSEAPGDAHPRVLVSNLTMSQLLVFRQASPRAFEPADVIAVTQPPVDMRLADFNGDGVPDVALLGDTQVSLWTGDPSGSYVFAESVGVEATLGSLVAADLNGDGKPDVAATSVQADQVTVVLNGVDAAFTPTLSPVPTRTPTPTRVVPTATPTVTTTPSGPGDADCSGRLDRGDIEAVVARMFAPGCPAADANGDSQVSAADLLSIIRRLNGQ
jgi:VCBS repeat protein/FG-GAP repeat protein